MVAGPVEPPSLPLSLWCLTYCAGLFFWLCQNQCMSGTRVAHLGHSKARKPGSGKKGHKGTQEDGRN